MHRFKWEDYLVLAIVMLSSVVISLAMSMNKKQTMQEFFLAGKSIPLPLLMLSYFSSFTAGGMTGLAIESYAFGAQMLAITFSLPIIFLSLYYLVIPVFHQLQQISILKYFEIRFGPNVAGLTMVAAVFLMMSIGIGNVYISAVAIQQVSALSFWIAATIMIVTSILYSTLGGMRGIVIANAIQAVLMVVSLILMTSIALYTTGLSAVWDLNQSFGRLNVLNFSFDPTLRHTVWSSVFGYGWLLVCFTSTSQILIQHCMMTSSLQDAIKLSLVGGGMTLVYQLVFLFLGIIMFAYYKGCNMVEIGKVDNINQMLSYFAMDVLHKYPTMPAFFFSGFLSATLSTTAALLNSISAIIIVRFARDRPQLSDGLATIISKGIGIVVGVLMFLGIVLVNSFQNFLQAIVTAIAVICGPTFGLYMIGVFCPQANNKVAAISFSLAIIFGLWVTAGYLAISPVDPTAPFSNCSGPETAIDFANVSSSWSWREILFIPSKLSFMYLPMETFLITMVSFIVASALRGILCGDSKMASESTLDLIPPVVKKIQMKLSSKWRRILLCDVYK